MAVRMTAPATEDEVIGSFAAAETPSSDPQIAARAIIQRRGWFFSDLLGRGTDWSRAEVDACELGGLRVSNGAWWGPLAPPNDLESFTTALEAGKDSGAPGFAGRWKLIRDGYDPALSKGLPIVAGETTNGPFTIVEGTHRLAAYLSRARASLPVPDPIAVFLGTGPPVSKWKALSR